MRKKLSDYVRWPQQQIKFVYRKRVLYPEEYDSMTIADARICGGGEADYVMAYLMDPEDDLSRPPLDIKSDYLYPRVILANQKDYFELLFGLLRVGGDVGFHVWKLLER